MSADVAERLRAAREAKGLGVADVAARLKVPVSYIEALDGGNADALPEATFVRGYARAYAKLVGLDAAEVAALLAPVEVKAPRPLVGISDIPSRPPARAGGRAPARLPRPRRHHYIAAGVLLLVAGGWVTWAGREPAPDAAVVPAVPVSVLPTTSAVAGGVSLEVPLPGAAAPATPGAAAAEGSSTGGVAVALPGAAGSPVPLPSGPVAAPAATAGTATPAVAAPTPAVAAPSVPAVPREGLLVRFSGDCWIEVRDGDNKVIHRSAETAGKDLRIQGKEPLTVTLGAAERATLWWNGDQVELDRFSRAGVARVNVGRIAR